LAPDQSTSGAFYEVFELMRKDMNFTFEMIVAPDGAYGVIGDNQNWSADSQLIDRFKNK
jgi:hypothetical protein